MKKMLRFTLVFTAIIFCSQVLYSQDNSAWELSWVLHSDEIPIFKRGWELKSGSDIDKDGWGEFITQSSELGTYIMFEASGDDMYDPIWFFNLPEHINTGARQIEVTDWDMDGNEEITIVGDVPSGNDALYVFEWDGTNNGIPVEPTITWDPQRNTNDRIILEAVGLYTQLDGDVGKEMILPFLESGEIAFEIIELSNANFENPQWNVEYIEPGTGTTFGVAVGDLDLDGRIEIVTADWENNLILVTENVDEDQYQTEVKWEVAQIHPDFHTARASLAMGNLGGGYPELFVLTTTGYLLVLVNEGDLSAVNESNFHVLKRFVNSWGQDQELRGISVGDQDRDGKPDIYFGNTQTGMVYDLEFDGDNPADSSHYSLYTISEETGWCGNVKISNELNGVMDLDGDNFKEIVVVSGEAEVSFTPVLHIFENSSVGTTVHKKKESFQPEGFVLRQNFPNPFNPCTNISYEIENPSHVSLTVYDMNGKLIVNLIDGKQNAGNYNVMWDGRNFSSGVYFYKLQVEKQSLQNKMLLLK
jgi:hypothetical protein